MKKHIWTLLRLAPMMALSFSPLLAQEEGDRNTQRPDRRSGDREGRRGGPPPDPIFVALDIDRNGELSAIEIKNAPAALIKLDRDGNGSLSRVEVMPSRGGRGGFGGPSREGRQGQGRGDMAQRIMGYDANGDGKVTAKELPDRMARMLERGDKDGDGALSKTEVEELVASFGGRGGGGRRGGGPAGGGRGNNSNRPQRPPSDQ